MPYKPTGRPTGRPKGAVNLVNNRIRDRILREGDVKPLEAMMDNLSYWMGQVRASQQEAIFDAEIRAKHESARDKMQEVAACAAPYFYPKLQAHAINMDAEHKVSFVLTDKPYTEDEFTARFCSDPKLKAIAQASVDAADDAARAAIELSSDEPDTDERLSQ